MDAVTESVNMLSDCGSAGRVETLANEVGKRSLRLKFGFNGIDRFKDLLQTRNYISYPVEGPRAQRHNEGAAGRDVLEGDQELGECQVDLFRP